MAHPLIVACMVISFLAVLICLFFPDIFWQTQQKKSGKLDSLARDAQTENPSSDDYWATLTNGFRCS